MLADSIVHGIRCQVGPVGPLNCPEDDLRLSEDRRIA
jgi:hypothetical protein